jgi:phage repressor protein C with HTH and peptisase S24 domain
VIYQAWLRPNGKYSCVRIKGGSMLPVLAEGDIVAVNHARTEPEDLHRKMIALSLEEEGVTIKYLQVEPDRRHLVVYAENRAEWEPRFLELDQLRIVGAVEWAWRKFE